MTETTFQRLLTAVTPLYERNDPAHDLSHALRVTALARRIQAEEGGDLEVIVAAALCHDLGRWEGPSHTEENGAKLQRLLAGVGLDDEVCRRAARAVQRHSLDAPVPPETLEEMVVFDADKVESLGAVGVGRCFAVSGSLSQATFGVEGVTAQLMLSRHLARCYERLHTAAARRIGAPRQRFLAAFIDQLRAELGAVGSVLAV